MFFKLVTNFSSWFHSAVKWWFTTLFGRIGILFSVAGFILIFFTYYIFNYSVSDKDTILDIQDAFLHLNLISSWNDLEDTSSIRKQLNKLKIKAYVYHLDRDTLCDNSQLLWANSSQNIDLCNYSSYYDSYQMNQNQYGVSFDNEYLSFGEYELPNQHFPSVFIIQNNKKYLLVTEYVLFNEAFPLMPSILLIGLFMFLLYVLIRRFLSPIPLMKKRIIALQGGDLDSTIPITGTDELALLSTNLNALIGEVKELLNQKERLLSEVSHELRTPLSKMRLLLALIPENNKTKKIDNHIQHLDAMITNILLSDKMSGAYANLDISKFSSSSLLKEGLQLSINNNVKDLSQDDCYISGDLIKLSVVIKNILDNINKYARTVRPAEFSAKIIKDKIYIIIQDFGPGIEKDLLNKIALPFTQGSKDKNKGFGLGLSICHKVVRAHHGRFVVTNKEKSNGAMFQIILPKDIKNGKK